MEQIFTRFVHCRKKNDKTHKNLTIVVKAIYAIRKIKTRQYQGDINYRAVQTAKQSLNTFAMVKKDHCESHGVDVLRKFLFQTSLNLEVKQNFEVVN